MEISFSNSFKRAFKKKIKGNQSLEDKFWDRIEIFKENPFDDRLKTHKLSGKLNELHSFSVAFDLRVIFSFFEKDKAIFLNIGSHEEVY
ncbi:type II toxin-antitoxin system YafQ family toxin [Bacteroidota bacterium]